MSHFMNARSRACRQGSDAAHLSPVPRPGHPVITA